MGEHTISVSEEAYTVLEEQRDAGQSVSEFIIDQFRKDSDLVHDGGVDKDALDEREQAVLAVVEAHIRTTEQQDVMGHLETFHPQLRTQNLQQTLIQTWSLYDLEYEFTVKALEVTGDEAEVSLLQTTKKLSGPDFQDTTILHRFQLVEAEAQWFIGDTTMIKQEAH